MKSFRYCYQVNFLVLNTDHQSSLVHFSSKHLQTKTLSAALTALNVEHNRKFGSEDDGALET